MQPFPGCGALMLSSRDRSAWSECVRSDLGAGSAPGHWHGRARFSQYEFGVAGTALSRGQLQISGFQAQHFRTVKSFRGWRAQRDKIDRKLGR